MHVGGAINVFSFGILLLEVFTGKSYWEVSGRPPMTPVAPMLPHSHLAGSVLSLSTRHRPHSLRKGRHGRYMVLLYHVQHH